MRLTGALSDWVSAKDVILEMLRRHGVAGGVGRSSSMMAGTGVSERHGSPCHRQHGGRTRSHDLGVPRRPRCPTLSGVAGARRRLAELSADADATYDEHDEIDLSTLEPLIACPRSPDNAVPVREVAGREIYQAYNGSSANPALRISPSLP